MSSSVCDTLLWGHQFLTGLLCCVCSTCRAVSGPLVAGNKLGCCQFNICKQRTAPFQVAAEASAHLQHLACLHGGLSVTAGVPVKRPTLQGPGALPICDTTVLRAVQQTLLAELEEAAALRAEAELAGDAKLAAEFGVVEARLRVRVPPRSWKSGREQKAVLSSASVLPKAAR